MNTSVPPLPSTPQSEATHHLRFFPSGELAPFALVTSLFSSGHVE